MATVAAILDFGLAQFSYFVSTRRPNAPHQVSTQLDHSLLRSCPKYDFSTYFILKYRAHTNAWGSYFDLAVKRSNLNIGPSF